MAVGALDRTEIVSGLRPFDPLRDILPVVELIEVAFAADLEVEGRQILEGMRAAASLAPLWRPLDRFLSLGDYWGGFVWVEEGKVVGNATLTRAGLGRLDSVISNVVVHPAHRRRGLALRLMEAAIDAARRHGAPWLSLEVRQENYPAKALYEKLGFEGVDAHSLLVLETRPTAAYEEERLPIRPLGAADEGRLHLLRGGVMSGWARRLDGEPGAPPPTGWVRLSRWGSRILLGEDQLGWGWFEGVELSAALSLRVRRWGARHRLELWARPQGRGQVERTLIARALSALARYPFRPTSARLRPSYPQAVESLRRMGFRHLRTLERMVLDLRA